MAKYAIWTEKYCPTSSSEIIGNTENIHRIRQWLQFFKTKSNFPHFKNGLIISGDTGIGKTITATILLKEAGYDVLEYNAGDLRKIKNIKHKLSSIVSGMNIMMMVKKEQTTGLIIDEIDTLTRGEKGSIQQIKLFIQDQFSYNVSIPKKKGRGKAKSKTKPKSRLKSTTDTSHTINTNPVICICNKINASVKKLLPDAIIVHFDKPSPKQIHDFIIKINQLESISMTTEAVSLIVENSQLDIRRCLNILQNLKSYFKNVCITQKDVQLVIKSFTKKDLNFSLVEAIHHLQTVPCSVETVSDMYNVDKHLVPLHLHENSYLNVQRNLKLSKSEKINHLLTYYDYLIDSNIIDRTVRHNHTWQLDDYIGILSCLPINTILNSEKAIRPPVYTEIINSPVFSKTNYKFYNLKLMNNIVRKIGISIDSFQEFTRYLYDLFVFENMKDIERRRFVQFLKSREFTLKDTEKAIKLSYLYEKYGKLFTRKMKNKLDNLYKKVD